MKTTLMTLMLCLLTSTLAFSQTVDPAPNTVAIYPASIESVVKMWNSLAEVCAKAEVESYDVYADPITDDSIVLKIETSKYAKFVGAAFAAYGDSLLRVSQLGEDQIASATFTYALSWAANGARTALDDEIKRLTTLGKKPEPKTIQIIVICIGKPDLNAIFGLFNKESK